MREQYIPGPSHAATTHRQKLMTNVENYLSEYFTEIDNLTGNLDKDRKILEEVTKRIENNEKKLEAAKEKVKLFEDNYKIKEPIIKVGEYKCLGSAT